MFFYHYLSTRAATYDWKQTDWSGGASTTATHSHTAEQANPEGWKYYYSKDDNVVTGTELTLNQASAAITHTTDGDFNAGTKDNVYVSGGSVYLSRPLGAPCSTDEECTGDNWCNAGTCVSPWLSGPCSGIEVYHVDVSRRKWKTSKTDCNIPQCGQNGGQNGDNLVANNSVNFTDYPARDACKDLGGRLPTVEELRCIYNHRSDYGGFLSSNPHWSSTEFSRDSAHYVRFTDGIWSYADKTTSYYVRCVR